MSITCVAVGTQVTTAVEEDVILRVDPDMEGGVQQRVIPGLFSTALMKLPSGA